MQASHVSDDPTGTAVSSNRRVLVVGGGIAGCACTWALERGGFEVTLLERGPTVGGNAKTHAWELDGVRAVSGLSVLAWPRRYFRNYSALLRTLNVGTEDVAIRFMVARADTNGREFMAHGDPESPLAREFAPDFSRWRRLVSFVRAVNALFATSADPSLYHVNLANPLNVVPLRLLSRAFGISARFWAEIFVPVHSSSFLTSNMDAAPAFIAPTLEDMISLEAGGTMTTWAGDATSCDVFSALVSGAQQAGRLHTGVTVTRMREEAASISVECVTGDGAQIVHGGFSHVVFACNARAAAAALGGPSQGSLLKRLTRSLLQSVTYADDDASGRGALFLEGVVHRDATVIPPLRRAASLQGCSNYVEVVRRADGVTPVQYAYDNTFILSSWAPCLKQQRAAPPGQAPCLVSYGLPASRRPAAASLVCGSVINADALPELTTWNVAAALLLPFFQGQPMGLPAGQPPVGWVGLPARGPGRVHFAGNWATPGNGHDLSLVSGLLAARRIGAPYPFAGDAAAAADFERAAALMDRCVLVSTLRATVWVLIALFSATGIMYFALMCVGAVDSRQHN